MRRGSGHSIEWGQSRPIPNRTALRSVLLALVCLSSVTRSALTPSVVSATVAAPQACPCTIFQPTDAPSGPVFNDNLPIELGVKFRSLANGFALGVRFYKDPQNTGVHVGHLWSTACTLLAEATFTSETASGWQEVTFSNPVPITANTTYIASYHSPSSYSATAGYFTSAVVNAPLRGLADGEDGPNGVFAYGEGSFPTGSFQQTNYWVDVVFNTTVPPDTTPPTVVSTSPGDGATGVATGSPIGAVFSESLDPATVSGDTFQLRDPSHGLIAASVSYSTTTRTASLVPVAPLAYSTQFTVTLRGGVTDPRIKDLAGNALASDSVWTFSTGGPPPPPPDEGPGGPILVLSAASNPFSRYPVEILRAEGLNEFTATDLLALTPQMLANYDVAILGQSSLSAAQVAMLTAWVNAGGTLIALRPDPQLAVLLGIVPTGGTLANAYLRVNTATLAGAGIVAETMQFHGVADLYGLSGATILATLYSDATTATANPAVTSRSVGTNGGQAIAFTYDLARSVVYTRQGNPAWAGQERDGVVPRRSDDLFFGNATADPQPDWVDLNKVAIPQADEQQRLLANLILQGNLHKKPLPRFWYLPKRLKAAVIMTGDDHGDAGMQPRFDIYRQESPANCSVDDWECVRATGYEYVGSTFTDAQAQFYDSQGFEVAVHILTNCADWTPASLASSITTQLATFGSAFPSIPLPTTNRTHCVPWSDWSTEPEVEQAHGIRLDANYYDYPASWVQDRPGMFTGSGIPMRFARLDGSIIDCYQVVTQMTDESGQTYPMTSDSLLARALDARGYYGAFCANMHFDNPNHPGSNAIVGSALARGVPVVSAKQMLTWLDGRNGSSFSGLSWTGSALSFAVVVGVGARNLTAMLPAESGVGSLSGLARDGAPVAYTTQIIKGITYAFFPADPGNYVATYQVDVSPPVIGGVIATPHADGTATIQWVTDEPSDSRVDYGLLSSALTLNASDVPRVTSHTLVLSGLSPGTTYYYRVTSVDPAGNGATQPPLASSPLSFTMPTPACFTDRTDADFGQGTATNTYVSTTSDGEVILAPTVGAEFSGSTLPASWTSVLWSDGSPGGSTVSGGAVNVDGGRLTPTSLTGFAPGRAVEFVATFASAANQHVGFGTGDNSIGAGGMFGSIGQNWAIFSTGSTNGPNLYARVNPGADVSLGSGYLGAPHTYRIVWRADSVVFLVDGASVNRRAATLSAPMRVGATDFASGGAALRLDWVRMTPYAASGMFRSRVYDAGVVTHWNTISWTANKPAGTSLTMSYRSGPSPVPNGDWTGFKAVPVSGGALGATARYIQYRAQLATGDPDTTPALQDVSLTCCTNVAPPAVFDLAAQRQAVDSDGDGTQQIRLTLTLPVGATSLEVYRAGFGNYPEYDDPPNAGSVPPTPSYPPAPSRWTLTSITASGQTDEVAERDEYYYAAFTKDGCGNVSSVSNVAGGTLNYVLGDVHDGQPGHECQGNNVVSIEDLSYLGSHYGASLAPGDPLACLDVGPTVTGGVASRPLTDNVLNMEDLIIFALNFGSSAQASTSPPSMPRARQQSATQDALWLDAPSAVSAGDEFTASLRLSGTGALHGVSAQLQWDAAVAQPVAVSVGELAADENAVVLSARPGNVDAVRLGAGFTGTGVVAEVRFRARASGDPAMRIGSSFGRDGANHTVPLGTPLAAPTASPARTGIVFAAPNPFRTRLAVQLTVAHAQRARMRVFDLSGRVVSTLLDGPQSAGVRWVVWDGRDGRGRTAPAGVYLLKLEAEDVHQSRRIHRPR